MDELWTLCVGESRNDATNPGMFGYRLNSDLTSFLNSFSDRDKNNVQPDGTAHCFKTDGD